MKTSEAQPVSEMVEKKQSLDQMFGELDRLVQEARTCKQFEKKPVLLSEMYGVLRTIERQINNATSDQTIRFEKMKKLVAHQETAILDEANI